MGNVSIFAVSASKYKRRLESWKYEDLSKLEIGPREQHLRDLPSFTIDKVMCVLGSEQPQYGLYVDIAVIKSKQYILK